MALLAEEIVEEWLNRQGYFTIRGIKMGVQEIDLLAVKWNTSGKAECRHVEVQASIRPVSYISQVPKEDQKSGRAANSAKRSQEELEQGVAEWVEKKFRRSDKKALMAKLWGGEWSSELVVNVVKSEEELKLIASHGIKILRLNEIVSSLVKDSFVIGSASGADIVDLIRMGSHVEGGA
ncbi:hypothetical protein [Thiobacter aerophilum]|uniref:DUF4365 domain-containing protein n=1 Tax=Thiobacter aerophilum TaxID=3121275 RepID=A0ABV0ED19_9BURK